MSIGNTLKFNIYTNLTFVKVLYIYFFFFNFVQQLWDGKYIGWGEYVKNLNLEI